jgi:hypothetical protein
MRHAIVIVLVLLWHVVIGHTAGAQPASPSPIAQAKPASGAVPSPGIACAPTSAACTDAAPSPVINARVDAVLDTIEKILKIAAYIVGGTWVYFNYFKGRTHKPRMEIKVSGSSLTTPGCGLYRVQAQARNVGLSKIEIVDEGSGLRILGYDASKAVDQWTHLATYPVLTKSNQWIEPGVTIEEHLLVPVVPGKYAAIRADLILSSRNVRWKAAAILS